MLEEWRYNAKSVTKYNPIYRDKNGHYKKEEWIGFFQVDKSVNGEKLSFDSYLEVENRYVEAAKRFFNYHNCKAFSIKGLEKNDFSNYQYADRGSLINVYDSIVGGSILPIKDLEIVIRLILRELIWAELYCQDDESIAIRFGHDFYMYFNSDKNWSDLANKIKEIGLFIW
jgi:hypothetical protein